MAQSRRQPEEVTRRVRLRLPGEASDAAQPQPQGIARGRTGIRDGDDDAPQPVSTQREQPQSGQPNDQAAATTAGSATEISPADVPDVPQLAPDVDLSGELQDGAFEEQQWLVQREGRYIQLTELLYRVLENVDGQRSLDTIADSVAEATGRGVSADNVRTLLASKLIPMGLVLQPDGTVAASATAGAPRSALQVNMRTAKVDAKYVEPIAAALQFLFAPPVLIAMLLIAAGVHVWLYFVHGVAGSLHDVMYQPGLLLAILGVIVLGTIWHEFGHAAALRYGGGKVRGMGAGLYIVYPAFYTDVTDNYRLSRWAKVRTDLGGFYFNFIFAIGLAGLYALTGHEFLLLAILLINLEIIHQLLPFVRLDGYWTLADLTGIPDFFSHIGPFLRTYLPIPGWKGRTLPPMKNWVKAVFAIYIAVTIPLLLFLVFMMVKGLPRVLATAFDSIGQQMTAFSDARGTGDVLGMLAALAQAGLLLIPTFGMAFVIYTLGRKMLTGIWHWGDTSPARRAISSVATAAVVALAVLLWLPQIPLINLPGPLSGQANFTPIRDGERGTFADAGINIPIVTNIANSWRSGTHGGSALGTPTATSGGSGSPTVTVTGTAAVVVATETAAATETASATQTVVVEFTTTATATATATNTPPLSTQTPQPPANIPTPPLPPPPTATPTVTIVQATSTPTPEATNTPATVVVQPPPPTATSTPVP